jgi:hypothetical protein
MNVKYGGKQKVPRESKIPSDPTEAKAYLGTYPAVMKWRGETLDCLLKPGDTQHYYFRVRPAQNLGTARPTQCPPLVEPISAVLAARRPATFLRPVGTATRHRDVQA